MLKDLLSELKKGASGVEDWRGVRTSRRERLNGGCGRWEVPSVVRAVQGLGDNLRTGGSVVKVNLVDVGPVSDGKDEGRRCGRRAEVGEDGEGRGHWWVRSASSLGDCSSVATHYL